jgi:hypothetical protein
MAQGGTRSELAFWVGGAAAPQAPTQGGDRSLLAFWLGGACAPIVPAVPGYRSMLGFWIGGACGFVHAIPPVPPTPVDRKARPGRKREREIGPSVTRDETEVLEILASIYHLL